ncbi:hypothetical protein HYPSUDRAFT_210246 [Hypholoma sublateritium FD-334 SS-4]|uniref:Uncharacterized protein n=1 Tax=Hypholoma sublateritium (strain FD-334 SS-4) TaxID=945553 RepID=A0A0D2NVX9_HYPSF|nr:hypothetical protein HYPSUDRAFT_210246 [Hypholoma sublateritium FD-334 SS-4]
MPHGLGPEKAVGTASSVGVPAYWFVPHSLVLPLARTALTPGTRQSSVTLKSILSSFRCRPLPLAWSIYGAHTPRPSTARLRKSIRATIHGAPGPALNQQIYARNMQVLHTSTHMAANFLRWSDAPSALCPIKREADRKTDERRDAFSEDVFRTQTQLVPPAENTESALLWRERVSRSARSEEWSSHFGVPGGGVTSSKARCGVYGRRALRAVSVTDNVFADRLADGCGAVLERARTSIGVARAERRTGDYTAV